jgi:hypothetical protein
MSGQGEAEKRCSPARTERIDTERIDTVVIGGGQTGLTVGYYLAQRNQSFVILEANERIGDSWRKRWDSLRLFTQRTAGLALPGDRLVVPHQGRDGRLPGGLRRTIRFPDSMRRPGGPALEEGEPVRPDRR